jgi:uncharacterized protein DUF3311
MSEPSGTSGRPPVVTTTRVIAGVCLVIPFVAMLWVGSYAKLTPEFIGIPFFYWYQMLWIFISVLCTVTVYRKTRGER